MLRTASIVCLFQHLINQLLLSLVYVLLFKDGTTDLLILTNRSYGASFRLFNFQFLQIKLPLFVVPVNKAKVTDFIFLHLIFHHKNLLIYCIRTFGDLLLFFL